MNFKLDSNCMGNDFKIVISSSLIEIRYNYRGERVYKD